MIPGNDDALRAIRLFASKIADAVIEGRALATEQDFTADKIVTDETPAEEGMPRVHRVRRSQVCREDHGGEHEHGRRAAVASQRKGPASETAEPFRSRVTEGGH